MTQKRLPVFWTLLVALLVAGLMVVAAQTPGNSSAPAAAAPTAPAAPAAPADPNAEVLTLGDTTVTAAEFEPYFEIALRQLASQQGAAMDPAMLTQFGGLRPNFLDQFATQQVLMQEAEKRGLTVSDADVTAEVDKAKASAGDRFQELLTQSGFDDEATLRSYIHDSLEVQQVVEQLQSTIKIGDAAVKAFYDENTEQFQQPEQACVRHILVAGAAAANTLYQQLQDGGDFAALARANSTDPGSAQRGGDLGCISPGQTVPPFDEAAFGAAVGDTLEPVQSEFGYHIIRVYKKNPGAAVPLAQVSDQVRQQLVSGRLGTEVQKLRDASDVEIFPENLPQTPPDIAPTTPAAPAAPAPTAPAPTAPGGGQ